MSKMSRSIKSEHLEMLQDSSERRTANQEQAAVSYYFSFSQIETSAGETCSNETRTGKSRPDNESSRLYFYAWHDSIFYIWQL